MTKFTDLHCKEVICVCDGRRLGFVADARIDLPEGQITALLSRSNAAGGRNRTVAAALEKASKKAAGDIRREE